MAVIIEDLWRTRYAADAKLIGSTILVNRKRFTVVAQVFRSAPIPLDARDPIAYGGVALLLVTTAVAAMLGPARRAASADPVHALRQD